MKNLLPRFASLVFLLAFFGLTVKAEPWRGIVPLKSTRAYVEQRLGKPLPGKMDFYANYELETEEVRVAYASSKLCSQPDRCDCRVPDDTVLHIVVRPKATIRFSSLELDKSKFHPIVNPENANNVAHSNPGAGIMYIISKRDDLVLYVQYGPTLKDCADALKAQEATQPPPKPANSSTDSTRDQPKGEVDLALEELKKRGDGVLTVVGGESPNPEDSSTRGVLNGQAVKLVQPAYPAIARSAHVTGEVVVLVLIDTAGKVMAAQVIEGHPLLRVAALKAAKASSFSPTLLEDKPVNVMGKIIYRFQ